MFGELRLSQSHTGFRNESTSVASSGPSAFVLSLESVACKWSSHEYHPIWQRVKVRHTSYLIVPSASDNSPSRSNFAGGPEAALHLTSAPHVLSNQL
ncbi:hypothetical protein RSAG8_08261, partial [Rhizoctonia solani AG-8 WAC10335]